MRAAACACVNNTCTRTHPSHLHVVIQPWTSLVLVAVAVRNVTCLHSLASVIP
jgi:hypothetical protein